MDFKNLKPLIIKAGLLSTIAVICAMCKPNGKTLTVEDKAKIYQMVKDSLDKDLQYGLNKKFTDIAIQQQNNYHQINVSLCKKTAQWYIAKNITNKDLKRFMLQALMNDHFMFNTENDETDTTEYYNYNTISNNYRWFVELVDYLQGKYSDIEFIKSDFFKVMNDTWLTDCFTKNAEKIDSSKKIANDLSVRDNIYYENVYNHFAKKTR